MNFWEKRFVAIVRFAVVVVVGIGFLVLRGFTVGEANGFYDIEFSFYKGAIDFLVEKGVVDGYADGSFRSMQIVNRAEFVKIVTELQGLDSGKLQSSGSGLYENCFSDVGSEWFAPFVCYGKKAGIVN
ncbi:MAG: S-layer homology domain-containing protein, partial [Candidatus Gracilibacteria bacterium]